MPIAGGNKITSYTICMCTGIPGQLIHLIKRRLTWWFFSQCCKCYAFQVFVHMRTDVCC